MDKYNPLSFAETLEEKREQVVNQCQHLIKDFSKRADRYKLRYRRLQTASIAFAALTTLLSAASASKWFGEIDWIVIGISGFATLFTTLLSQTNAQKMWIESRNISQEFQTELFLYLQCAGAYEKKQDDLERLKLFSKHLMNIWSKAQESWSNQALSGQ